MTTVDGICGFQHGCVSLYLSNYELWPLWQGRIWKEVSVSSEGASIVKLQRLKSKINSFAILKGDNCSDINHPITKSLVKTQKRLLFF